MLVTRSYPLSVALQLATRKRNRQKLLVAAWAAAWKSGKALAALPFDALRISYASAVRAGLVENSMLASRDFEHAVAALERVTLGPLARRV